MEPDIEDLAVDGEEVDPRSVASEGRGMTLRPPSSSQKVKALADRLSSSSSSSSSSSAAANTDATPDAALPGRGKIWVRTWGCSHNLSDSEYMAGLLASHGYDVVEDESGREEADLWLLNSCTVKDPSQAAFVNLLKAGRSRRRPARTEAEKRGEVGDVDEQGRVAAPAKLILSGCVPQADRNLKSLQGLGDGVSLVGVAQLERIVEVVERTLRGECVRALGKRAPGGVGIGSKLPKLSLPKVRRNPLVEIVPLSTGCLGACTYCKTKHARGTLGSYPLADIVARVREAVADGVTEVWLSSEDTGAYGIDLGTSLTALLEALTAEGVLGGTDVMLRVGMTNPPYMLDQLEAIAAALSHPNVFSFLHVPVQSGADPVLTAMNREYTVAEFEAVADGLLSRVVNDNGMGEGGRERRPGGGGGGGGGGGARGEMGMGRGFTLATDIICGFPGETDVDFAGTMRLVEKYRFPVLNISQFYARPGTPAAKMRRVPNGVAKARSRRLTRLFESLATTASTAVGGCDGGGDDDDDDEEEEEEEEEENDDEEDEDEEGTVGIRADPIGAEGGDAENQGSTGNAVELQQRQQQRNEKKKKKKKKKKAAPASPHSHLVGRTVKVWVNTETTPVSRERPVSQTVGHTKAYIKVLLPLDPALVGTVATVSVTAAFRWHVVGEVLDSRRVHPHLDQRQYQRIASSSSSSSSSLSPSSASSSSASGKEGAVVLNHRGSNNSSNRSNSNSNSNSSSSSSSSSSSQQQQSQLLACEDGGECCGGESCGGGGGADSSAATAATTTTAGASELAPGAESLITTTTATTTTTTTASVKDAQAATTGTSSAKHPNRAFQAALCLLPLVFAWLLRFFWA